MENDFFWNDELAKEFCEYVGLRVKGKFDIRQQISLLAEDFKRSKEKDIPKGVIFTTSDGKDLYFMDGYYLVPDDFSVCFSNAHPSTLNEIIKSRTFSTQEKAKEYIYKYKPVNASFDELYCFIDFPLTTMTIESLKSFFKSKIKL